MSNEKLLARRNAATPQGVALATSVFVKKAKNAEVWDTEGKRYLDFAAGIAVCNTGHRHPKVMAAATTQCENFVHTAFQVLPYESYIALAERLNNLAPISNAKTLFMTTGVEAVENAVKIARYHTKRNAVISFVGAFHGRSLLALGMTGKMVPYKAGFGPFPTGIYHAPFPIEHHGVSVSDSITALEQMFKADVQPQDVAAIIIEPVQGEGGFYIAPKEFMQALRKLCDKHGILLICDEIQTGFARTGKLFASEYSGIEPDLMTIAKGLAGGFPLSGVIGKSEIMDSPEPGGIGGTFAGSPISCSAALAVLDVIEEEQLCARSCAIGEQMVSRINAIKQRANTTPIGDVRGLGAMVAFELVKEYDSHKPNADKVKQLTAKALEYGLVLLSCGIFGNTIRLLVPLTISDKHLEEGLNILERALIEVA